MTDSLGQEGGRPGAGDEHNSALSFFAREFSNRPIEEISVSIRGLRHTWL